MEIPPTVSAPLLRLPVELQLKIFSHAEPNDKICLALSCRRLLQTSTMLSLGTFSAPKHRSLPDDRCPDRQHYETINVLLQRLRPLDAGGRKKRTWCLCAHCLRYRPRRASSYWKLSFKGDEDPDMWLRAEGSWLQAMASWSSRYTGQCPECWFERRKAETRYNIAPWRLESK